MNKKCLNCGSELNEKTIGYSEKGEMLYRIRKYNGDIKYLQKEFMVDNFEFYCIRCDNKLNLTDEKIIELLK